MNADAIRNSVLNVTKKWAKQRRAEKRKAGRVARRRQVWNRSVRITLKDAAYAAMEQAYLKASANGKLPALARQIMYAGRPTIQEETGEALDDQYFTQTLLPDFMQENESMTAEWDVVWDARGNFFEPHTGAKVPLGTVAVRNYLAKASHECDHDDLPTVSLDENFPTAGAKDRFGAILFLEKEGFHALLERVKLAQRYDIALMSTKGLSNTASRTLIDKLQTCHPVPLLVLHDFDKSGFSIFGTLQRDTRRYEFLNKVRVVDLGLRLDDVKSWELQSEDVAYGKSDPRPNLLKNGATEAEVDFLCNDDGDSWSGYRGARVELNAFTSDKLVEWIEQKLVAAGVRKVIPENHTLQTAYRRAFSIQQINRGIEDLTASAIEAGQQAVVPKDLKKRLEDRLRKNPGEPWDRALAAIVEERHGD